MVFWGWVPDPLGDPSSDPAEGVYWSASQYQIHFGKLREALLEQALAAGAASAPLDRQELMLRADILASRTRLLSEPSVTRDRLRSMPGFDERVAAISAFNVHVQQVLGGGPVTAERAHELLASFDAMDRTVESLANVARQREMDNRTHLLALVNQRRLYTGLVALVLWGWLVWILMVQRRDRRLARERLAALEAEQRAKVELQRSINTKAQFLSMVSHELRSPLQVIVSSIDLLDLGTPAIERRNAVARIRRAAMMLGVQLRDLLTIARGEAGRFETNPESFEATSFVKDIAEVASHIAGEKGLRFDTHVPVQPVFVRADVQRISQVLANLVSNAVKYTVEGGVTLSLAVPDESAGQLVFVVADTGPGLPAHGIRRLQTPLARDEELRPRLDGSGVGLTVVRTVMDHLDGRLDIDARDGVGTRFTVTIPVLFEDPDAVPSEVRPDGLVLVVDDQADISASVAALVERHGHPCHVARSGAQAISLLTRNVYETAFLDLDLPGGSGVELANWVRREGGPNRDLYLVAITAARPRLPDGLFDEVLIKPVEGLRVWWHLGHRSRARTAASAAAPVFPPSGP
jgi:signal transduction histidine kinase/CheY-like chemotaxis protein